MVVINKNSAWKGIVSKGLFYPDILKQASKYQPNVHISINKDSVQAWSNRNPVVNLQFISLQKDTLRIGDIEEIKFTETTITQKRFRFWMFTKGFANPVVYFMELTNKKADANTDIASFIDGAELSFFEKGWVIR